MERKRVVAEAEEASSPTMECSEPPKKARKKSVTAKSLGLAKAEWERLKPLPLKKNLKQFSKKLTKQVEADWHDGCAEQSATVVGWASALGEPLQAVLDVGVGKGLAFEQCNEVLRIVGDSWRDLSATPCRLTLAEMMGDSVSIRLRLPWGGDKTFTGFHATHLLQDMAGFVWRALLRAGANAVQAGKLEAGVVFRAIKDAKDNGVAVVSWEVGEGRDRADGWEYMGVIGENGFVGGVNAGPEAEALDRMVGEKENWEQLEQRIRTFRTRRCVDRRVSRTAEEGAAETAAELEAVGLAAEEQKTEEEVETCSMQ